MVKISKTLKEKAWRLYNNKGYSFKDVSEELEISSKSAWLFTIGRERGFNSYSEYELHLLARRGKFKSIAEYHNFLDSQKRENNENRGLAKLIKDQTRALRKTQK